MLLNIILYHQFLNEIRALSEKKSLEIDDGILFESLPIPSEVIKVSPNRDPMEEYRLIDHCMEK